jgi:mannosyl-oligosaccharide glucosidase
VGWVNRGLYRVLFSYADSTTSPQVPSEFQVQYPSYANPPTLPVAVTSFIARLKAQTESIVLTSQLGLGSTDFAPIEPLEQRLANMHLRDPELAHSYLTEVYPALRRHYQWFRRTQRGQLKEWSRKATSKVEAYRWRGRTEDHVLTSGLDDYPRARPPHPGELHLDLMSWMGYFAKTMAEVAEYLGEEEDLEDYKRHEKGIVANLDGKPVCCLASCRQTDISRLWISSIDLHWNEEEQMYCDASVNEEGEYDRGPTSLLPAHAVIPQTNPFTFVTAVTSLFSPCCSSWSHHHHHMLVQFSP